jgi:hypothetical protein
MMAEKKTIVYESEVVMGEALVPPELVRLAGWLEEHKVQVVCWDFDETAMNVHTGGFISETSVPQLQDRINQLSYKVAPHFRSFCRYLAIHHPTIKLAIVSFADDFSRRPSKPSKPPATTTTTAMATTVGGTNLISGVLERGFAWPRPSFYIVSFYPDVANSVGQFNSKVPQNKTMHLQLVAKRFGITQPSSMLLIDNDHKNCLAAAALGYHTWFVSKQAGFDPTSLIILS